jgi:hypothetical protein
MWLVVGELYLQDGVKDHNGEDCVVVIEVVGRSCLFIYVELL